MAGIKRCQYSHQKCFSAAIPSSNFCSVHDQESPKCQYMCPYTHVRCYYIAANENDYCQMHKMLLEYSRKRYYAFEEQYADFEPAHKRKNEVDFVGESLTNYSNHARYVDLLSRANAVNPVAKTGVYSVPELNNIKNSVNQDLENRLKETRPLYVQRSQAAAYALQDEIKNRQETNEKYTIVTNSSADTALVLKDLVDDHQIQMKNLPIPDKEELLHPAARKAKPRPYSTYEKLNSNVHSDCNNEVPNHEEQQDGCSFTELFRNVRSSINADYDMEETDESAVNHTMEFMLDYLEEVKEPVGYKFEYVCSRAKISGFKHCFQHLWKEVPSLKKCIQCDQTCTLSSNVCGKCLKPFIDIKTENMVTFSDDYDDIPTVSIGGTDGDLTAILTECTNKLKDTIHEEIDDELELAAPHKLDNKNLTDGRRLEFMWGDFLKFGFECDNVKFENECNVANEQVIPDSVPETYNRQYDIDKMIAVAPAESSPKPQKPQIIFRSSDKDNERSLVCRFPTRTLSDKVATHLDKPTTTIGIKDYSVLPSQFRAAPVAPPPPPKASTSLSANPASASLSGNRPIRPTFLSPANLNTYRHIKDLNPAARTNPSFTISSMPRHPTPNILSHSGRGVHGRPLRLFRPQSNIRYVTQPPQQHPPFPQMQYGTPLPPATTYGYEEGPPVTYIYYTHAPVAQTPPTYRRYFQPQ